MKMGIACVCMLCVYAPCLWCMCWLDTNTCMCMESTGKLPTLVLDLDETLVHCTVDPVDKADVIFPVE
ncbi:hypothetical protein EON63_23665 [archaeon]|nr:MAG: hypothetical protein EON63_23665 [archaeon]